MLVYVSFDNDRGHCHAFRRDIKRLLSPGGCAHSMDQVRQRPRLNPPRTLPDYIAEALSLAGILAGLMLLAFVWTDLPGDVPRHFGFSGEPTAWSGQWSIVAPIVIAIITYAGLTVLGRVPHVYNYLVPITEENAAIQYRLGRSMVIWLKTFCVWMFVVIVWTQARVALGETDGLNPIIIFGFLIAIHVAMAVFLIRSFHHRDGEPDDDHASARS